ncbi:MAG: hypothetical protein AUI57_10155 [Candidatus Rokubacteria bacterium 13_1_40CM_2_68_8]|nr:MAG: hypothetical protein AUI57_10155 [Candidatus Rokubacteria bacterium 13_1_40CM_2_68_8]
MPRRRALLAGVSLGSGFPVAVMGVLNVSPESFYAGSVHTAGDDLLTAALAMVEAGAALIDVGARSTAPYLDATIGDEAERARLARAIDVLAPKVPVPISADTACPGPARAALEAGARVINDVSGLRDPAVAELVRERGAGIILMASPQDPGAAAHPIASDVGRLRQAGVDPVASVQTLLARGLERARAAGISEERVVLDPGIGFCRRPGGARASALRRRVTEVLHRRDDRPVEDRGEARGLPRRDRGGRVERRGLDPSPRRRRNAGCGTHRRTHPRGPPHPIMDVRAMDVR